MADRCRVGGLRSVALPATRAPGTGWAKIDRAVEFRGIQRRGPRVNIDRAVNSGASPGLWTTRAGIGLIGAGWGSMSANDDQLPLDPSVPFTRARALIAGLTDADLRGRRFQRVITGVYVDARARVDVMLRARAALVVSPDGSHASHFTAAEIWDLCPPDQPLTHVSVPSEAEGCRRRGVKAHEMASDTDVVVHRDVPVSSPVRTFVEMSEVVGLVDLVVIGDRAVTLLRTTPQDLVQAADAHRGRGARRARRAARLVREGVDSPMETRLRLLIVLAGLPEPVVNLIIRNVDGSWRMRFDLSYPDLRLVVEYDGRQHAEDVAQWDRDIDRREELDEEGWRIIVVRSTGIYVCPERTLHRVRNALRQCGARNLPRRFRPEWREHFPGRVLDRRKLTAR